MSDKKVGSSVALLLIVLLSAAIFGWIVYSQDGVVTETYEVGTEGIKKAQEVKRQLEQEYPPETL